MKQKKKVKKEIIKADKSVEKDKQEQANRHEPTATSTTETWRALPWVILSALIVPLVAATALAIPYVFNKSGRETDTVMDTRKESPNKTTSVSPETEFPPVRHRQEPLPLLDHLFPDHSLDGAWEIHPLLSSLYEDEYGEVPGRKRIPTVHVGNQTQRFERLKSSQDLLSLQDVLSVLYPQGDGVMLEHGEDYRIVRKIWQDGQEWTAMPQGSHFPPEQLIRYVSEEHGWSLIINHMHKRWKPIVQMSKKLQEETACFEVNCNLYLTPQPKVYSSTTEAQAPDEHETEEWNSGFESHWDEMDVLVVQLVGQKVWSVAQESQIYLGTPDQRY